MTACVRGGVVLRVLRWGLSMAAVAALTLGGASPSHAQTAAKAPAPKAAASAAPAANAGPSRGGNHESIAVHGHWVIEVRNPDGKVVSHTEFENALSPGFTVPTIGPVPGGEAFLSALMTGQVLTPISWGIYLEGPNGLASGTNAPCVVTALTISPGACLVLQNSANSNYATFVCNNEVQPAGTSCNLAVSLLGTAPNFSGFQLSGNVIATQSGSINFVATADFGLCGINGAMPGCAFSLAQGNIAALTGRPLDGQNGDPVAVPVTSGQTIQVTVTISFGSGS